MAIAAAVRVGGWKRPPRSTMLSRPRYDG